MSAGGGPECAPLQRRAFFMDATVFVGVAGAGLNFGQLRFLRRAPAMHDFHDNHAEREKKNNVNETAFTEKHADEPND